MDALDTRLKTFFAPATPPRLARRVLGRLGPPSDLSALAPRFAIEASDRGVRRLAYGRGRDAAATRAGRRHLERAREELTEYLAGRRTFFSVPLDLEIPPFQARVLAAADRVPFGEVSSYAELARRIRAQRGAEPILVAVTGYGQADDQRRSREAGFDAHLTKPVTPDHLAEVLARLARRPPARRAAP